MKIINKILGSIIVLLSLGLVIAQPQGFMGDKVAPTVTVEIKSDEAKAVFHFSLDPAYHITDIKHGFFKITLLENDYFSIAQSKFPKGTVYDNERIFKGPFEVAVFLKQLKKMDN